MWPANAARRVGETVGYQVRFEEVAGPRTRLRFLTEGVLTRRMLSDPDLERVGCVVLDEFHERHLEGDLALALLRRLQRTRRPDLKIVVMSATLDAAPIAEYLAGDAARYPCFGRPGGSIRWRSSTRRIPPRRWKTRWRRRSNGWPPAGSADMCWSSCRDRSKSGARRPPARALARRHGWQLLPLYGDQSPEEQDRAVAPCAQTKIILSTNVAESSITIDGVSAVIDSGLARVASHSPWSGLPALQVARISQASANQRAGRAGRTGPGRAIRLYPQEDFVRRPAQDVPQILREDLAPTALLLQAMNTGPEFARLAGRSARRRHRTRAGAAAPTRRHGRYRAGNGALSAAPAIEPPDGGSAAPRRGSRRLCGGRAAQRRRPPAGARAARLALGPAGAAGSGVVAVRGAAVPAVGRHGRARHRPARRNAKMRSC